MRRMSPVLGRSFLVAVAALVVASTATGQSPSPAASNTPSPAPSATTFPWPTFTTPPPARSLGRFVPRGRPDARTQRDGIRMELWLDRTTVAPGEWVPAHLRVTNTQGQDAWSPGGCGPETAIDADLAGVLAPGMDQAGPAALVKAEALRGSRATHAWFRQLRQRGGEEIVSGGAGGRALALLDCGGEGNDVMRLGPGESIEADFAWFPAEHPTGDDQPMRPLPPGPVTVTGRYELIRHGAQPLDDGGSRPITVSTTLTLTGEDPGTPSPGELLDAALADPGMAAWLGCVTHPTRGWDVILGGWGRTPYPTQDRWLGLESVAPDGVVQVALMVEAEGDGATAYAMLDPWTGAVLRFSVEGDVPACAAGTVASASPSPAG